MAQKENIYRVGFGRIRLGFDQNVTTSDGLTPEQVNNLIDAKVPNITFNNGGGTVPFATLNGQTYYFPPTPKTYDSVYPIKRTPGQSTDTFSLMYDTDTLGVQDNKLYAKAKPVTYELPLKEENGVVKVIVGNSMTKSSGSLNVKVSGNDRLLSVDGNGLKTTISIDGPNDVEGYRVYTIKGKANITIGTISFPIQEFVDTKIDTLSFDTSTKKLTIVDTTGSTFETTVPYKEYVQGDGININGSAISVKYDGTTIIKDSTTGNLKSVTNISGTAPVVVSENNVIGFNYNENQFAVTEGVFGIKNGVIPDISTLTTKVTNIEGDITQINTTLETKADETDLSGKLDIAQPNVTAGNYLVVKEVNGTKKVTFEPFPFDDEEIDAIKNLGNVLIYKGVKSSISELPEADDSEIGDVWFVNIGTNENPKYAEYVFNGEVWEKLGDHEQVVYTGGTNITINGTTISCDIDPTDFVQTSSMDDYYTKTQTDNKFLTITDAANTYLTSAPEYTSGDNYISVNNTNHTISVNLSSAISNELTNYYTKSQTYSQTEVDNLISGITDNDTTYTAGTGISIDENNEISCTVVNTDTTYSGDGVTVTIDSNNVISANIPVVPDMTNYYTKSQTYNKTEVDNLINGIIDNELSSTSEHALQNKVLYNELRVTESSSSAVLTINGTNYPIVELDASTFPLQNWVDSYDTDHYVYIFPILDPNKAYIVHNTAETRELYSGAREFAFASEGTYIVKFDAPFYEGATHDGVTITSSDEEGQEEEAKSVSSFYINTNQWLEIPATSYFYTRTGEPYTENYRYDTSVKYYGLDGTVYGYNVTEIPAIQNATETTGSTSTVKSLKQKIAELEARIAAVEEWIEH